MKELHKRILSVIVTMLLLPYILTLFISGQDVSKLTHDERETVINVEVNNKVLKITESEYIIGLLAKEVPVDYAIEAMKAQAIIIRTRLYKENFMDSEYINKEGYFTYEDILKKWNGKEITTIYDELKLAVDSTSDLVITVSGELVITPYHIQNIGNTRSGENGLGVSYSHLNSVECSLDVIGINASSKNIIKYDELAEKCEIDATLCFDDINILETAEDGYVLELGIGEKIVKGEAFRQLYQLNSTVLSLQEGDDSYFQVTTRGNGHGIGLSQNTAHFMAMEGKEYGEILKYFYTGIEIKNVEMIMDENNKTKVITEDKN